MYAFAEIHLGDRGSFWCRDNVRNSDDIDDAPRSPGRLLPLTLVWVGVALGVGVWGCCGLPAPPGDTVAGPKARPDRPKGGQAPQVRLCMQLTRRVSVEFPPFFSNVQ